jgi:hypothetical protein
MSPLILKRGSTSRLSGTWGDVRHVYRAESLNGPLS